MNYGEDPYERVHEAYAGEGTPVYPAIDGYDPVDVPAPPPVDISTDEIEIVPPPPPAIPIQVPEPQPNPLIVSDPAPRPNPPSASGARQTLFIDPAYTYSAQDPEPVATPDQHPTQSTDRVYKLYKRSYESSVVTDWQDTSPDLCDSVRYWANAESFQPHTYRTNSTSVNMLNNILWAIPFVVQILIMILMFAIISKEKIEDVFEKIGFDELTEEQFVLGATMYLLIEMRIYNIPWNIWGVCVGSSLGLVALVVCGWYLLPGYFTMFAPFVVAGISLIAMIIAVCLHTYGAIAGTIFNIIFALMYWLMLKDKITFTVQISTFVKKCLTRVGVIASFLFGIGMMLLWCFVTAGVVFHGVRTLKNGFLYFWVICSFWNVVMSVGQMVYQMVSQIVASYYFVSGIGSDYNDVPIANVLQRNLWYNIGIAIFNGTVLPFVTPFYLIAKMDLGWLQRLVGALPFIGNGIVIVVHLIQGFAIKICTYIDKFLGYPNERGSVYSSMFGISRLEGCRRIAETDSKHYTDVLGDNCYYDFLFGFIGLWLSIMLGFSAWARGRAIAADVDDETNLLDIALCRMFGGYGFFICFAFFHMARKVFKGITDTLWVCFYEHPNGMAGICPEIDNLLRTTYQDEVTARSVGVNINGREQINQSLIGGMA